MTRRDPRIALRHMLSHAREAIEMVRASSRRDLDTDRKLELAILRLLEVIGEAAGRVPTEERDHLPEVPWHDIVALRNRLIHGYDAIDLDVVWEILEADLPLLVDALEAADVEPEAP